MALTAEEKAELESLEKELSSPKAKPPGLSADEASELAALEKELGNAAPATKAQMPLEPNVDKMKEMFTGKFQDTGRTPGFGEQFDSVVGVPVRTALNEKAKGAGLLSALWSGAKSVGQDPKTAPSGYDVATNAGVENPYLGTALATAIDVGAQLPVGLLAKGTGMAAKAGSAKAAGTLADLAERKAFKALEPMGKAQEVAQAKGLVNSIGRTALDEGVVTPFASKRTMLKRAEDLAGRKTGELDQVLKEVAEGKNLSSEQIAELEKSKFVPSEAAEKLKAKIRSEYSELPEEIVSPRLEQVDAWLKGNDPKDILQTQKFKTQAQKFIKDSSYYKDNPGAAQDVLVGVRNAAKEGIEKNADAYAGLLDKEGGRVKDINRQTGNALDMADILDDTVARNDKNKFFGLTDFLTSMGGYHAMGPKGIAVGLINKGVRSKGNQILSSGANAASKVFSESPALQALAKKDPNAAEEVMASIARSIGMDKTAMKAAEEKKPSKGVLAEY